MSLSTAHDATSARAGPLAGHLAKFSVELELGDLPAPLVERVQGLLLDQVACQVAAARLPWLALAREYVTRIGGSATSRVLCWGDKVPAENAALANGAFAHGMEFDDAYAPGLIHPGACVVPAVLAVAEREEATGADVLASIVTGYEVMGRISRSITPGQLHRGFHPTSVAGPMGAAAGVARLLRVTPETAVNALAVAASSAAGLTECYSAGGEVKRYHAGFAAAAGIRAVELARLGLTGPPSVLEGPLGMRAFTDDFHVDTILEGMGEDWVALGVWIKVHCCNGIIHGPLDALDAVREYLPFESGDVAEIVVGTVEQGVREVGQISEPWDVFGFQTSMQAGLALRILRGSNGYLEYMRMDFRNPDLRHLAELVTVEVDAELESAYPERIGGRVTVTLRDGRSCTKAVPAPSGTPENPVSQDDLSRKARSLLQANLAPDAVDAAIALISDFGSVKDANQLTRLLVQ